MPSSTAVSIVVHDGIGPTLAWMVGTLGARVVASMEEGKGKVEEYAKSNAPWEDRTGDARDGLIADLSEEDGVIVLELAHSVEYGIYLETIEDGAFAIIMPTLEALGPEILHEAGAAVTSTGKTF
jgi:hypothetical protein